MSITLVKIPAPFTPMNGAIFQVTSTRPTIIAFIIKVLDSATSALILTQRYYTLPQTPTGTSFDLAPLLQSVIGYQLVNTNNILENTPKVIKKVGVYGAEVYLDGSGNQVIGADQGLVTFAAWNARFSRYDFSHYNYLEWEVISSPATKFLSIKPLVSRLFSDSKEFLYFGSTVAVSAELRFYKKGVGLIGVQTVAGVTAGANIWRLNLSPDALSLAFGTSLGNMYGHEFAAAFTAQFGTNVPFTDVNYFTVQMTNGTSYVSEQRTYILTSKDCRKENVEILFGNRLGGFDSMFFTNPKHHIDVTRRFVDVNPFKLQADGSLIDFQPDGVYNQEEVTLGVDIVNSYTCISEPLTDSMAVFAKGVIESKSVYVKLSTGELYPVQITEAQYDINKRKYNPNNFRLSISFKINGTSNIIFN